MKYQTFEDYLNYVCFEENSIVLDDEMSDFFDNWLVNLDGEKYILYADEWMNITKKELLVDIENLSVILKRV